MGAAADRSARLEAQIAELDGRAELHFRAADIELQAAQTIRARQAHMRALVDLLRASELPAMVPVRATIRNAQRRAS